MKTLLLTLFLTLGFVQQSDANYFSVHCRPSPVAAFNGSASQTCPFAAWYLSTATNYSYFYYNWLYWGAYNRYCSQYGWNGYYWCNYWRTRNWLVHHMCCAWQTGD